MTLDFIIFKFINNFAEQSKTVDMIGIFLAQYLPYFLVAILLIFIFYPKAKRKENQIMVFIAIISAFISRFFVKSVILFFYNRPRPFIALSETHNLLQMNLSENFQSFPSGHTMFFFAIATGVYFYNKKLGTVLFICTTLISLARIFVGVHWPSDIIGGAILGILTAFVVQKLYLKFGAKINSMKFIQNIKNN